MGRSTSLFARKVAAQVEPQAGAQDLLRTVGLDGQVEPDPSFMIRGHADEPRRPRSRNWDGAIRQLLPAFYRLIYRVEEEQVVILAVLHQREDVGRWSR